MKKMIFTLIVYSNFCIANEPPVLQTFLPPRLPSISSDLLAIREKLSPETKSQRETHEQEVARLIARIQDLELRNVELHKVVATKDSEMERLNASVRLLTKITNFQKQTVEATKKDLLATEHRLEEMAILLEQQTHDYVDYQVRIKQVTDNGYKRLEEIKADQRARGVIS